MKFALVTGASSGLGREFALNLASRGSHSLVLLARRREAMEEVAQMARQCWQSAGRNSLTVEVFVCDLRDEAARESFLRELAQQGKAIDLLINNAGFGSVGSFAKSSVGWQQDMIEVNCKAVVHFTRTLLDGMIERNSGWIVNVASVAAFQPMPCLSTYAATKAFVLSFSTALECELRGTGVSVTAVCPGPTATEFQRVSGLSEDIAFLPSMSAERVVREALDAVFLRKAVVVHGLRHRLLSILGKHLPGTSSARIVAWVLRAEKDRGPGQAQPGGH